MAAAFAIQECRDERCCTLVLTGELDIASAPKLERRVMELCLDTGVEIVLDLGHLSFIDSSGLNAILRLKDVSEERGCELYLTPGPPPVQRLFDITRLKDRLPFRKSSRS